MREKPSSCLKDQTFQTNQSKSVELWFKLRVVYRVKLITTKMSTFKSLLPSNNAILQAIIKPTLVLPVDVTLRAKPADLSAEPSRELGRIEPIDRADPTLAGEQFLVVSVDVVPEDGDETHPGYHDAFLRIRLAFRSGDGWCGDERASPPPGGLLSRIGDLVGLAVRRFDEWVRRRRAEGRGLKSLHGGSQRRREGRR